ncbi:hypothetical protein [Bradyrhizobium sp. CCBAU 11361]|uniref:hypothetical protein n=1 Tax=Bradyrhizobium sp. CCBAU 11361 TaxID=1630812 RepID=UPI002304A03C|nr:hypothetical protein [Bradyrhizobium sp. CCBAU 11361]MDA9489564.1 hypothetical protein [Bradyrhizobium sp. CCBAU 11361]
MTDEPHLEEDDDDIPWASPEIQSNYEAALGRFILAFNRLDNHLTEVIETVLARLNRSDLVNACTKREFSHKLLVLDLLKTSSEGQGIKDVSMQAMRDIAMQRNKLAHGHFDQNPFDGTYDVVTKGNVRSQYSVEDLDALTESAAKAWDKLRYAEAYYAFSDVPIDDEKA